MGSLWPTVSAVALLAVAGLAEAGCPPSGDSQVQISRVSGGDAFFTRDGREVALAGVLPPEADESTREFAGSAREALTELLRQGGVSLAAPERTSDRYGRMRAQVFLHGSWVQGTLLRAGMVRAAPDEFSMECAAALLVAEEEARAGGRGLWGRGAFAVRSPEQLTNTAGTFQIVEGVVQNVATRRGRTYVNFGSDWRTDFTVTVAPEDMPRFREARINLRKLKGKRVRVRGWMESYYGPQMSLALPQALEELDLPRAKAKKKRSRSKTSGPPRSGR